MKIESPIQQTLARPSETVPQPAPQPLPQPASQPALTRPLAIVVVHGMGQQIPFETIDQVTAGLQAAEANARRVEVEALGEPRVRVVKMDKQYVRRVELDVTTQTGARDVHIYEAYWAPKPHGNVTLRDVIGFLFRAGLNGLTNIRKPVHRMLFGKFRRVPAHFGDLVTLVLALLFVPSLVALNIIIVAAGAAQTGAAPSWLTAALFADLSLVAMLFNAVAITTGALLYVALMRRGAGAPRLPRAYASLLNVLLISAVLFTITVAAKMTLLARAYRIAPMSTASYDAIVVRDARTMSTILVLATLVLVILAWAARALRLGLFSRGLVEIMFLAIVALGLWAAGAGWLVLPGTRGLLLDATTLPRWLGSTVWVWPFLVIVAIVVRRFLLEFVGDVAVYVASHTLDRFDALRNEIKNCVQQTVDAVYHAKDNGADTYENVIIMGHSLGSVIAYDALNRAIIEDELSANQSHVVARTTALITFGSPLDKIAFLFAVQSSRTTNTREGLVAAGLPLIQDYRFRPPHWINIHAPHDIISGKLDLYDDSDNNGGAKRVTNISDPDASIPLIAHTEYWRNKMVFEQLYARL